MSCTWTMGRTAATTSPHPVDRGRRMNGSWQDRSLLDLLHEFGLDLLPEHEFPTDGWSGATFTSIADSDGRRYVLKRTSLAIDWIAQATATRPFGRMLFPLDIARAKAICSKCSLAPDCVSGAIERAEPWGVWGGELIENGRIVVNKRPRGRPPKNPRPAVVIDEVPIPPHLVA